MQNTTAEEVFESFESTFQDKKVIPEELETLWLLKAIGRYSVELDALEFDEDLMEFDHKLNRYEIDTLGILMKQFYQERELSRVNKQVSIVTKDISIDSGGHLKTAARNELEYCESETERMMNNLRPTAYV